MYWVCWNGLESVLTLPRLERGRSAVRERSWQRVLAREEHQLLTTTWAGNHSSKFAYHSMVDGWICNVWNLLVYCDQMLKSRPRYVAGHPPRTLNVSKTIWNKGRALTDPERITMMAAVRSHRLLNSYWPRFAVLEQALFSREFQLGCPAYCRGCVVVQSLVKACAALDHWISLAMMESDE
jgi:hypothetical protein